MRWPGLFDSEWDLIRDADAVAFEGHHFFRMIGQHADVLQSQIDQDLRADAAFVLDQALARGLAIELAPLVKMNLRQRPRLSRSVHRKAAPSVMEVQEHAPIFTGDSFQRARDKLRAIA